MNTTTPEALRELAHLIEKFPFLDASVTVQLYADSPNEVKDKIEALLSTRRQLSKREGFSDYIHFIAQLSNNVKVDLCVSKENLGCRKVKVIKPVETEEWQCADSVMERLLTAAEAKT
jgi:hypothetical protein